MQRDYKDAQVKTTNFSALVAVISLLTSAVVIFTLSSGDKKWIFAVVLGLMATFLALIFIDNLRRTVFLLSIFALPIRLDVFLYRKETDYVQLHGLPLTLFDILFLFLLITWILDILKRQKSFRFYPEISLPALIAILFCGISVSVSNDTALSFCAFLLFIKCYLIFLYFANNIDNKKELQYVLWVLMLSVLFQGFVGMLQYVTGSTLGIEMLGEGVKSFRYQPAGGFILSRVGGTVGGANGLAMYLNLFLPVLFCAIFIKADWRLRFCSLATLVVGGVTELLTLSRGGWVALAAGLFLASYVIFKHRFRSRVKSAAFVAIFGFILSIGLIAASSDVRKRLFEDDYKSAFGRVYMLEVASNIIQEHPFLGVGVNSYTSVMERYDHTTSNISYKFPYPVHNAFFRLAAECGIFAVIAILFVLFSAFCKSKTLFKYNDGFYGLLGVGFTSGLLARLIQSQFEPMSIIQGYGLWFCLALITAIATRVNSERCEKRI